MVRFLYSAAYRRIEVGITTSSSHDINLGALGFVEGKPMAGACTLFGDAERSISVVCCWEDGAMFVVSIRTGHGTVRTTGNYGVAGRN